MGNNDTRKAANDLKQKLDELSQKNLMDTAVRRWTADREDRRRGNTPQQR